MKESSGIIFWRCTICKERTPNLSKTSVSVGTLIANYLPMQRLQSFYSSCAHGCSPEFSYCDMHIMQLLKVIGMTLEQTPRLYKARQAANSHILGR